MDRRITDVIAALHTQRPEAPPLTIAALAAAVSLSPSRLAHLFRREVGTSPARYLRALRLLRARVLLERTFLTVREVMVLVGCNDASHFSRDFRRFHGVPPTVARTRGGGEADEATALLLSGEDSAAVARIAALANDRLAAPRRPRRRARARAPDPSELEPAETSGASRSIATCSGPRWMDRSRPQSA